MAMSVTYTNFGGMLVHENRGGVETEYVPDTLGSVAMCRNASGNTTYTYKLTFVKLYPKVAVAHN